MKIGLCLVLLVCLSHAQAAETEASCHGQTALELSYCKLLEMGATGLPPLYEFRKNGAATQYLLLKRPAARLGVSLTPPPRAKSPPPSTLAAPPTTSVSSTKASPTPQAHTARSVKAKLPNLGNTSGCQIAGETISCGAERYQLQWNKPKAALTESALSASNQLQFPPPPSSTADTDDYLLQCYQVYIQKMLAIGLGNTTLSFATFDGIYTEAKNQHFDFAARFNRMYHFLKEERKTLQPPKGFGQAKPQQIDDCTKLSDSLWTCQTADHHWVFAKN